MIEEPMHKLKKISEEKVSEKTNNWYDKQFSEILFILQNKELKLKDTWGIAKNIL